MLNFSEQIPLNFKWAEHKCFLLWLNTLLPKLHPPLRLQKILGRFLLSLVQEENENEDNGDVQRMCKNALLVLIIDKANPQIL